MGCTRSRIGGGGGGGVEVGSRYAEQVDLAGCEAKAREQPRAEAVQVKSVAASAVQVKSVAASAVQVKSVAASAVQVKSVAASAVQVKSVAASAVQVKSVAASAVQVKSVAVSAVQVKSVAAPTVQVKSVAVSAVQVKSVAASAVQVKSVASAIKTRSNSSECIPHKACQPVSFATSVKPTPPPTKPRIHRVIAFPRQMSVISAATGSAIPTPVISKPKYGGQSADTFVEIRPKYDISSARGVNEVVSEMGAKYNKTSLTVADPSAKRSQPDTRLHGSPRSADASLTPPRYCPPPRYTASLKVTVACRCMFV